MYSGQTKARTHQRYPAMDWLERLLPLALALGTLLAVIRPFRTHANWMYFEQDDFFYYLKVAQNLATGHGSTCNGLVPTNGYHPLWMLLLAALLKLGAGPRGILIFLAVSIWTGTLTIYLLSRRILSQATLGAAVAGLLSVFVAAYYFHLAIACMETTFAVPLLFALMAMAVSAEKWIFPTRHASAYGLAVGVLTSSIMLARVDAVLFAALLSLGVALQPALRQRIRAAWLAGFVIGLLPAAAYLVSNRVFFGVWLPISGLAKQLKLHAAFSYRPWQSFLVLTPSQWVSILVILAGTCCLPKLWSRLSFVMRALAFAALAFPWIYYSLLSWRTDWRLWSWYFYALQPALCVALLVLLHSQRVQHALAWKPLLVTLILVAFARGLHLTWDQQNPTIVDTAMELRHFAETHPGVYAMGDRSGAVSYLLPKPMVQAEGLVMDREYLERLARQEPLTDVLRAYNVRYYIGTARRPYTGCFHAVEPWQAGPQAPHLQADFCTQPVAAWTHGDLKTLVFELGPSPGA